MTHDNSSLRCPRDGHALHHETRHGVEIEHCPHCRGIWLDRGELDKIVAAATAPVWLPEPASARADRLTGADSDPQETRSPARTAPRDTPAKGKPEPKRRETSTRKSKSRRKSLADLLEDIFDF